MQIVLTCLWVIFWFRFAVFGMYNVTIDDSDPRIKYVGGWVASSPSDTLDYGGFHHWTTDPTASASFSFTGVAIYFMSPLWPDNNVVVDRITLDSSPPSIVPLQDFSHHTGGLESVNSSVVWSMTGLTNAEHYLTISFVQGKGFAIVDALIYTVDNQTTSTAASSSTTSSSTTTTTTTMTTSPSNIPTMSSSNHSLIIIALGTALGVVGLVLLVATFVIMRQRKQLLSIEGKPTVSPYVYPDQPYSQPQWSPYPRPEVFQLSVMPTDQNRDSQPFPPLSSGSLIPYNSVSVRSGKRDRPSTAQSASSARGVARASASSASPSSPRAMSGFSVTPSVATGIGRENPPDYVS